MRVLFEISNQLMHVYSNKENFRHKEKIYGMECLNMRSRTMIISGVINSVPITGRQENHRRFVVLSCCSEGFAPNQLSKQPIGVACNERFSTAFSALFCNVCSRAVA